MRALIVLLLLASIGLLSTPVALADVGVRTCDTPTYCHDVVVVRTSAAECDVDVMKKGLGKPPSLRTSCLDA